jgi:hypothetical protein
MKQEQRLRNLTIPESRVPTWDPGVEGGIPDTSAWPVYNVADYGATGDGSTNDRTAIYNCYTAAKAAYPNGSVVYFPADQGIGRYKISATGIGPKSNQVFKGDDPTESIIYCSPREDFSVGIMGLPVPWEDHLQTRYNVTSGATRGSTQLVLASAPGWSAGQWFILRNNSGGWPSYIENPQQLDEGWGYGSTYSSSSDLPSCMCCASEVDGPTITLDRPLRHGFDELQDPGDLCVFALNPTVNAGFENLQTEWEVGEDGYGKGFTFARSANCWAYNCISRRANMSGFLLSECSARCTIQRCKVYDCVRLTWEGTPNGGDNYSVQCTRAHDCLISDNILTDNDDPLLIHMCSSGNVFEYNYGPVWTPAGMNECHMGIFFHGEYSTENLVEANHIWGCIVADDYWGRTGPRNTMFRNRAPGYGLAAKEIRRYRAYGTSAAAMGERMCIEDANYFLGHVYGASGYTDDYYGRNSSPYAADGCWFERNVRTADWWYMGAFPNKTDIYTVQSTSPPSGWPSFAPSLWRTVKPTWWTAGKAWPCTGADVDDDAALIKLPAQDRYEAE